MEYLLSFIIIFRLILLLFYCLLKIMEGQMRMFFLSFSFKL